MCLCIYRLPQSVMYDVFFLNITKSSLLYFTGTREGKAAFYNPLAPKNFFLLIYTALYKIQLKIAKKERNILVSEGKDK